MIAIDSNLLVYALRTDSPFHEAARSAITGLAEGLAPWAIPWPCMHEFYAIATRAYRPPTTPAQCFAFLRALARAPHLRFLHETPEHLDVLERITHANLLGGAIHDARIAAICLSHGVRELWSADRDFTRFPQLKVRNPLLG